MTTGGHKDPTDHGKGRSRPFLRWIAFPVTVLEMSGKIIAATTLTFMFCVLLVNVIMRYAFNSGIPWASEIHAILLPWLVAGGIVVAAVRGRNIAINLLPDLISDQGRRWLFIIVNLCILVIAVNVLWSSQPILKASQFQRLSTLGIKQVWGYSSLVYAFGAMAIIAAAEVLRGLLLRDTDTSDPANSSLS